MIHLQSCHICRVLHIASLVDFPLRRRSSKVREKEAGFVGGELYTAELTTLCVKTHLHLMNLVLPPAFPYVFIMHINGPSMTIAITQVSMVDQTGLCKGNSGNL